MFLAKTFELDRNCGNPFVGWLNAAFNEATQELAASGRLAELGIEPVKETPEEFARFVVKDVKRNSDLLRSAKFEPV